MSRPPFAIAPAEGEESVWDYPRPPRVVGDDRTVVVKLGKAVLAQTHHAVRVLETSHPPTFYLPRADIDMTFLTRNARSSRCEWKGSATYWDVDTGKAKVFGSAWSYDTPFAEFDSVAGHISFYPGQFECRVGGIRVLPQPGSFYGGWVTPELVGPFKGEPGTSSW